MAKLVSFLFILLLLGCTESKAKPTEQVSESSKLECASPCDDEKIKAWYQKKYGEPITGFELSAKSIFYEHSYFSNTHGKIVSSISVTRTAAEAIATVTEKVNKKKTEHHLKLNLEEWLDFIRILSKLRFDEWEEVYYPYEPKDDRERLLLWDAMAFAGDWTVKIIYSDTFKSSGRRNAHPSNFNEFQEAMRNMEEKVKETPIENKLKTEYEKKFGMPISDIELSTRKVRFEFGKYINYPNIFYATRTATGGFVTYGPRNGKLSKVELNTEGWIDFIRALYKCRVNEWNREYGNRLSDYNENWNLDIFYSNDIAPKFFNGYDTYPSNWAEFKKVMDDMVAKIKEKAGNK